MNLQTLNHPLPFFSTQPLYLFKTSLSTHPLPKPLCISLYSFSHFPSNSNLIPVTTERSTNNSPDNIQISDELNNLITLQQQIQNPHTLTIIHQLSSTITSSNPPTPTPTSDYTPSLAQSSKSTESSTSTNRAYSPITHFHPNPEPPENTPSTQLIPILPNTSK